MNKIIKKIEHKVIVSVQASHGEPFYKKECMAAMMQSAINGGAAGLRVAGAEDISLATSLTDIPIIGITKPDPLPENWKDIVYITPDFQSAKSISNADIIAIDGTSRKRLHENLADLTDKIHNDLNRPVMADISTLEEGLSAALLGADIISTTLSGYTTNTIEKDNGLPDFELLEKLVSSIKLPIILEGRVWSPEDVKKAFELGAYAVVIGSAITRPHLITKRFVNITGE
ncbi:MAG: N-acetylmannosamine-6-phosphate 2-epimerase [bacterium]